MSNREIMNLPMLANGSNNCLCCGEQLSLATRPCRIVIKGQPQKVNYTFGYCPICDITWGKAKDFQTIREHFKKRGIPYDSIILPRFNVISADKNTKTLIQDYTYSINVIPSVIDAYNAQYESIACNLKSACYQFGTKSSYTSPRSIYTIVSRRDEVCPDEKVIHYSSHEALTLLTAAHLHKRQCMLNGQLVNIERFIVLGNQSQICLLGKDDGITVQTKKNGGYFTPNSNIQQVIGLVFSPRTRMMQCLALSYDMIDNNYFVSPTSLRDFRDKYGYPVVRYRTPSRWNYCDRADESLVHALGYNVQPNISIRERRAVLTSVIEAGLCTTQEIVNLLESFIRINGQRTPNAQKEWEADLNFITQYKVAPEIIVAVNEFRNDSRRIRW